MSEQRGKLQRQIEELRDQVSRQDRLIRSMSERIASLGTFPQIRVARTTAMSPGGYPGETSGATAFGLIFKDALFSEAEGARTLDGDFQDNAVQRVGLSIPGTFIPENTDCLVAEVDGRHYIIHPFGGSKKGTAANATCVCELIELLRDHSHLSEITSTEWDNLEGTCECDNPKCSACTDPANTPSTWDVTISGVTSWHDQYPPPTFDQSNVTDSQQDAVRDLLNATHTLTGTCASGNACGWCKEITYANGLFDITIRILFTIASGQADLSIEITENRGTVLGTHLSNFQYISSGTFDCTASIGAMTRIVTGYDDGGPPEDDGVFYIPFGTSVTATNPVT